MAKMNKADLLLEAEKLQKLLEEEKIKASPWRYPFKNAFGLKFVIQLLKCRILSLLFSKFSIFFSLFSEVFFFPVLW